MAGQQFLGEYVKPGTRAEMMARARLEPNPWLRIDPALMRSDYNRSPFLVAHRLHENPLFTLAPLFQLCRRLGSPRVGFRIGRVPVDTDFDESVPRFSSGLTLDDVLDNFEARQAYIVVNNPERDPLYRPVIEGLVGELAGQLPSPDQGINWYSTYIFVSTQNAVTPYHMDREMNFLLQVRGTKTAKLWDPADREVMTDAQKDHLLSYAGGRPTYSPSIESKATIFRLTPGLGVHHPFIAPHIVQTDAPLSISLAVTFRTRQSDIWTEAHQVNHRLRRLGFHPTPVGVNSVVDKTKSAVVRSYRLARAAVHRLKLPT